MDYTVGNLQFSSDRPILGIGCIDASRCNLNLQQTLEQSPTVRRSCYKCSWQRVAYSSCANGRRKGEPMEDGRKDREGGNHRWLDLQYGDKRRWLTTKLLTLISDRREYLLFTMGGAQVSNYRTRCDYRGASSTLLIIVYSPALAGETTTPTCTMGQSVNVSFQTCKDSHRKITALKSP
jgi:hypothetical protein